MDEHTKQTHVYEPEVNERRKALIELFKEYNDAKRSTDIWWETEPFDQMILTLSALIEEKVKIHHLSTADPPYYHENQLMSRGNLKKHYRKDLKPILEHFKDQENLEIHDEFQTAVVTQFSEITQKYIELDAAKKAVDAANAHKAPSAVSRLS